MKRIFTLIFVTILALGSLSAAAQEKKKDGKSREEMRKELREYKLKFLCEEMGLSGEVKTKFAQVFEENFEEQAKLFKEIHSAKKVLDSKSNPTDDDYSAFQKTQASVKQREQSLETAYRSKLDKILSPKHIYLLQQGEDKFREKMHEIKAKKGRKNKKGTGKNK